MSRIAALAAAAFVLFAAPAAADDYAATARNIIPSGQYGGVPAPAGADAQALMYDGLTPLFDQVTAADLQTKFKSEHFGLGEDGPGTVETVPRAGVTIVRDRFNVPHITGQSRDDVTWAMGWVLRRGSRAAARAGARRRAAGGDRRAEHRRVRARDQPAPVHADAAGRPDDPARRATPRCARRAPRGARVRHDIDVYLEGLNARLKAEAATRPWTRVDVYARTRSPARSSARAAATRRAARSSSTGCATGYGRTRAQQIFDDLSEFDDPDSPATHQPRRSATGAQTAPERATSCSTRARSSRPARAASAASRSNRAGRATS